MHYIFPLYSSMTAPNEGSQPRSSKDDTIFSQSQNEYANFFLELFPRLIGHEDINVQINTVLYLLKPMACHGLINAQ